MHSHCYPTKTKMDSINLLATVASYKYDCLIEIFKFLNETKKHLKLPNEIILKVAPRLLRDKYLFNDHEINYYINHYILCKGQLI